MIDLKLDKKDIRRMQNGMEQFQKAFGKSAAESVRETIGYIGRAAYKTTKQAKPYRKIIRNDDDNPKFPKKQYKWKVEVFSSLGKRYWYSSRRLKSDVKHSFMAHTRQYGLARSAWGFALSKAGNQKLATTKAKATKWGTGKFDKSFLDPSAMIQNELSYATDAMRMNPTKIFNRGVFMMARKSRKALENAQNKAGW